MFAELVRFVRALEHDDLPDSAILRRLKRVCLPTLQRGSLEETSSKLPLSTAQTSGSWQGCTKAVWRKFGAGGEAVWWKFGASGKAGS